MSAIEFKNAKGQVRYQPAHPDGRRLYGRGEGWRIPFDEEYLRRNRTIVVRNMAEPWSEPLLYRTKRRAYRQVSKLIVHENEAAREKFKETK